MRSRQSRRCWSRSEVKGQEAFRAGRARNVLQRGKRFCRAQATQHTKLGECAIILKRSERERLPFPAGEEGALRLWGYRQFNPPGVVFRPLRRSKVFRFLRGSHGLVPLESGTTRANFFPLQAPFLPDLFIFPLKCHAGAIRQSIAESAEPFVKGEGSLAIVAFEVTMMQVMEVGARRP